MKPWRVPRNPEFPEFEWKNMSRVVFERAEKPDKPVFGDGGKHIAARNTKTVLDLPGGKEGKSACEEDNPAKNGKDWPLNKTRNIALNKALYQM